MSDYAANKSSAELEREVEAQRHRVSDTIDEIQGKMSPGQLLDEVMDYTKGGGMEFAQNLGRSVRDNPLPVVLVGAGLLWLMTGSGAPQPQRGRHPEEADYGYGSASDAWRGDAYDSGSDGGLTDKARKVAHDVSDGVSGAMGGIGHSLDGLSGSVNDMGRSARHAGRGAMHQLNRQTQQLGHLYEDQPLIGGALAFALGAALGAALPHTRQEDEVLGETADSVKKEAADKLGGVLAEGRQAAEKSYGELKESVETVLDDAGKDNSQAGSFAT